MARDNCRGRHLKLVDNVKSFLDIQRERFETWMNVYFTLLRNHVLCDDVQICEGLVHKGCYIVSPLQNFSVDVGVNEV